MVIIPGRPRHPAAGHSSASWPSLGIPGRLRTSAYSGVDAGFERPHHAALHAWRQRVGAGHPQAGRAKAPNAEDR
jgi:hypothetical protein